MFAVVLSKDFPQKKSIISITTTYNRAVEEVKYFVDVLHIPVTIITI